MEILNTVADKTARYNMMKTAQEDPTSFTGMVWWANFLVTTVWLVLVAAFFGLLFFFGKRENFENQEKKPVKKNHWLF